MVEGARLKACVPEFRGSDPLSVIRFANKRRLLVASGCHPWKSFGSLIGFETYDLKHPCF